MRAEWQTFASLVCRDWDAPIVAKVISVSILANKPLMEQNNSR